nr:hypothetical protein [Massilia genomosp. 1]
MAPQYLTEGVMRERLAELGHAPRFGCELTSFEQDDEGLSAHLFSQAGEEVVRALSDRRRRRAQLRAPGAAHRVSRQDPGAIAGSGAPGALAGHVEKVGLGRLVMGGGVSDSIAWR